MILQIPPSPISVATSSCQQHLYVPLDRVYIACSRSPSITVAMIFGAHKTHVFVVFSRWFWLVSGDSVKVFLLVLARFIF